MADLVADALDLSGEGLTAMDEEALSRGPPAAALIDLSMMHNRISAIEHLEPFTALQKLSLRANRVEAIQGLECCTALRELELYENQITSLCGLAGLRHLSILDVIGPPPTPAHTTFARPWDDSGPSKS